MRNLIIAVIVIGVIYLNIKDRTYNSSTLIFGTSIPQTGIMKAWGSAVHSGANAYFSYVNDTNLLKDKKIQLITYDDKYEPELTFENLQRLISKQNIFALFGFVGTPTVKNILPYLNTHDIPFVAPFTGASFLRTSQNENIINFRSSYQEEIDSIVNYLHTKKDISRFAVFYQNDEYGEEGFISLLNALNKRDLKLVGEGTYKRNTLSIRHAFNEIKDAKPQAVIMVGAYKSNALFIKTAKEHENFKDTIFCNVSFSDADQMIQELDFNTQNLLFSQIVPYYKNNSIHVILEYKKLMRKYYPNEPLSFISLESFLAAKSVVLALQNIKGSITRNKFLEELKTLKKDALKGLSLEFKNRQLHNKTYLFEYKRGDFIKVNDEN